MKKNQKINRKILMLAKKIKAINLKGGKCIECGEENIFKLEFHHITNDKITSISAIRESRWSIIKKEIEKCIILCSNCHREIHFSNTNDKRQNIKRLLVEIKGGECQKCGYDKYYGSLEFHHKEEKEFNIGDLNDRIENFDEISEKIIDEIEKCEILCRNCHLIEHTDLEFFEKYKNEIYKKSESYREIQPKVNREEIKRLYNDGMKQIDISKKLNIGKSTVNGCIKELKKIGRLTERQGTRLESEGQG